MTQALFDKLARLEARAAHCELLYLRSLAQEAALRAWRRALEQRIFTLLSLSRWVKGRW